MLGTDIKLPITAELNNIELADNPTLPGMAERGNVNNNRLVNDSMVMLNETIKDVLNNFKVFSSQLKDAKNNGNGGGIQSFSSDSSGGNFFGYSNQQKMMMKGLGIMSLGTAIANGEIQRERAIIHGDWLNADVIGGETANSAIAGLGDIALSAAGTMALTGVGAAAVPYALIAGGALKGIGAIGGVITNAERKENDEFSKVAEHFSQMDALNVAYGNPSKDYDANVIKASQLYKSVTSTNIGTGLTDGEYTELVLAMKKYGVNDLSSAKNIVGAASALSQSTNGDVNQIAHLMGLSSKYNGNIGDIVRSYEYSDKAGFNGAQYEELLNGIENSISAGINKGYTADVKNMLETTTMLGQTGNSPFWKGTEAVARNNSISQAVQNATGLNSTNDMLLFRAMTKEGEDPFETLARMEKGNISPDELKAYYSLLKATYGNDETSIKFALKSVYGSYNLANEAYQNMNAVENYKGVNLENKEFGYRGLSSAKTDIDNSFERESVYKSARTEKLKENDKYGVLEEKNKVDLDTRMYSLTETEKQLEAAITELTKTLKNPSDNTDKNITIRLSDY